MLYVFGAFLVVTGWRMYRHRNDKMDASRNPVLRLVARFVPSTGEYVGQRFWVRRDARWLATPLFTVQLKAGLAAILVFVGVKMLLLDVCKAPIVEVVINRGGWVFVDDGALAEHGRVALVSHA